MGYAGTLIPFMAGRALFHLNQRLIVWEIREVDILPVIAGDPWVCCDIGDGVARREPR